MKTAHDAEFAEENADSDEDLPTLQPSTLTALNDFLDEQATDFEEIVSLSQLEHATSSTTPPYDADHSGDETEDLGTLRRRSQAQAQAVPVHKFKRVFKENWQLSQFWYTQDTAERLAHAVQRVCPTNAQVAFVCCPTGYVAFKEIAYSTQSTLLLEYDRRFSLVAGESFVHYDLDEPLSFPRMEALGGSQDIVVVDPPFHSEVSQRKIASTIAHILRPNGRLVLLTGLTLSSLIDSVYYPPLPKLRRRGIIIEHDGVGRLATPYGCWTGGGPEGQDDEGFGEPIHDRC